MRSVGGMHALSSEEQCYRCNWFRDLLKIKDVLATISDVETFLITNQRAW